MKEKLQLLWWRILWFLEIMFVPTGVVCEDREPTENAVVGFIQIGKEVQQYGCRYCKREIWAWKKRRYCRSLACSIQRRSNIHKDVTPSLER